ncbi:MAG: hypothetical protein WB762_05990 [Candidatus Sulfotelmatobacter sp.]
MASRRSLLKGHYVTANFSKILGTAIYGRFRFSGKQLTQRGLCAFNPAR